MTKRRKAPKITSTGRSKTVTRGSKSKINPSDAPQLPEILRRFSTVRMQLTMLGMKHMPTTHDEWFRNGTVSVLLRQDRDDAFLYPFDSENPATLPKDMNKAVKWHYKGHEVVAIPRGVQSLIGGDIYVEAEEE